MLLVCPSCRTRYVVPDSAIGGSGRQVRCANCRHSWYQEGPSSVAPPNIAPIAATQHPPAPVSEPVVSAPDFASSEAPSSSPPPPMIDAAVRTEAHAELPSAVDDYEERSQFAHEPPFRPRRNPAKIATYAAIAFAVLVTVGGAALWYSGALEGRFTSSLSEPKLEIVLHDNLTKGEAADGTKYFIASGSIVNSTAETQRVPDMLVTLKDASGRPVFNWQMKAPVRSLAPGATADFSQMARDVPPAAARISIHWAL